MDFLGYTNASIIGQIAAFVGIGAILDLLVNPRIKETMSAYLTGSDAVARREFEYRLITGLLEIFMKRHDIGLISKKRVLIFSSLFVSAPMLSLVVYENIFNDGQTNFQIFITFAATLGGILVAFFCDLYSIKVTKSLFYYKAYSPATTPLILIFDFIASVAPLIVFLYLITPMLNFQDLEMSVNDIIVSFFLIGVLGNLLSSVIVNIFQIIVIVAGYIIRFLAFVFKSFSKSEQSKTLSHNPFSLCFLVFALVQICIEWMLRLAV